MTHDEQRFAKHLMDTITEHPDWVQSAVLAIQGGIAERLNQEQQKVSDLSTGLIAALDKRFADKKLITQAVKQSTYAGTAWAKKYEEDSDE